MSSIEDGRVCVVTDGRRAGEKVVISKVLDGRYVMVKDKKGKERKISVKHLDPTDKKA